MQSAMTNSKTKLTKLSVHKKFHCLTYRVAFDVRYGKITVCFEFLDLLLAHRELKYSYLCMNFELEMRRVEL